MGAPGRGNTGSRGPTPAQVAAIKAAREAAEAQRLLDAQAAKDKAAADKLYEEGLEAGTVSPDGRTITVGGGTDVAPVSPELKKPSPKVLRQAEAVEIDPLSATTNTQAAEIQTITAPTKASSDLEASAGRAITSATGSVKTATAANAKGAETYTADKAANLAGTVAATGRVGSTSIARATDATLSERAVAASRVPEAELAARARVQEEFNLSPDALIPKVNAVGVTVSPTPDAEKQVRNALTDNSVSEGEAAKIVGVVGYEAAQRRTVTGKAAKGAAATMLAEVGQLPPEITAAIVEDPASVEASLDNEPVEVRAAIAALPTEALVSSQIESLLGGMEDGETPLWARPAVAQVEAMMAKRGLSVSSVGRDALFNSIIQSAMPIAQSNAQALQTRAAQNLSNEQQANMSTATLDMQRRLSNSANQQTANSQTAQMAQQMATMQSQFRQDAVMTTAQMQQQTRTQNLSNLQETAKINAMNEQAMRAQNLGNEQQVELAEMQFMNATQSENMTAKNQERMAEMQVAADFLSKNAGFKQQMELANLTNDQQLKLANLSALNQASADNLNASQQTELANLNKNMQTNLTGAKIAQAMGIAQLNADQQRAVGNASTVANLDMAKFNEAQQVELANSKFMQSMVMTDFNADQQAAMQNATAMATMDLANADARTKVAVTNAQSFLKMDMLNLNNRQQATVLDQQMKQQRILSDQSASNASKQFNATSENQTNQFITQMANNMQQFNATQTNAMSQFNASEKNKIAAVNAGNTLEASKANMQIEADISKFNSAQEQARETWNAANAQAVEQSNVQWRRKANTANTAAQNAANQINVQNAYNMSAMEQTQIWQQLRDEATYVRQAYEASEQREAQLYSTALGNEALTKNSTTFTSVTSSAINKLTAT